MPRSRDVPSGSPLQRCAESAFDVNASFGNYPNCEHLTVETSSRLLFAICDSGGLPCL
jgi:hypothetical protein